MDVFKFYGDEILVGFHEGQRWVAVKPICEALGVRAQRQQEKLVRDPKFSCTPMYATGSDGKSYEMLCIPVSQLNGWLFSINPNRSTKPGVAERLLVYQQECMNALFEHFMPQGGTDAEIAGMFQRVDARMDAFDNRMDGFDHRQGVVEFEQGNLKGFLSKMNEKYDRILGLRPLVVADASAAGKTLAAHRSTKRFREDN